MAKRGNLILLVVSLILALAATLVIVHSLPKQSGGAVVKSSQPVDTANVVVVNQNVPSLTPISSADVKLQSVPASAVESGAATSLSQVIGQYAVTNWVTGQQVIRGMYETAAQANFATQIPAGERAFTIPDSATTGVDYLILPGDTVDLLFYGAPGSSSGGSVVLSNLKVLYVDHVQTVAGADTLPASTSGADSLTVAVTPQQAVQLAKLVANTSQTSVHVLLHRSHP